MACICAKGVITAHYYTIDVTPEKAISVCSKANLPRKMVISYQNYLSEDNLLKLIIINKWRSEGIMR
jgi:hypothetical protein